MGRGVHSGSRGLNYAFLNVARFIRVRLAEVEFIRVGVGSLGRKLVSSGSLGFP